jgi:N-acetylmuramoyl-L-alanine amidase
MRVIKFIVIHCTATPQTTTVESIQRYWRTPKPKGNGWKDPGYHHIIKPDGSIIDLHPIDKPSNGVQGHNARSIHISYIGGIDAKKRAIDNRTDAQKTAQICLLKKYHAMFPDAIICGHRDFLKKGKPGWKDCPSFDVEEWLKTVEI